MSDRHMLTYFAALNLVTLPALVDGYVYPAGGILFQKQLSRVGDLCRGSRNAEEVEQNGEEQQNTEISHIITVHSNSLLT